MEVVTLTITLSDPLAKFWLIIPAPLCFAGLEVLVLKEEIQPPASTWFH
jgi:hypothetical protein